MAILRKIYPFLILPFLTGCEEVFTPDMPHTPVLCVNSLITTGEPVEAVVSKSRLYTDTSDKTEVKDADLRIYANGVLQLDSYIPKEGDNIRIVAESPTLGRGEADLSMPMSIKAPTATWETYDVSCWKSDNDVVSVQFKLKVALRIEDPDGENYYKFSFNSGTQTNENSDNLDASGNYGFEINSLVYKMEPIFSEHIGIFESIMGGDADGFTFFSDRQFSGKSYTLNLQFDNCWFRYPTGEIPECKVNLIINSVSPSYYNWANYVWQRDNGTLSDLSDYGLGDPIWGYSNVSSGAGVVAAQSKSVCMIDLTDFILKTINETIK
ncbi:DUF4249 family protein [Muribaculum sp. NM65_B17]|mgnify:FL=1|uniref:DUF4249 family protein n=2 Tax=Muribaculum TaxID=1918540 RepID=UPI001093BE14|nr:DUF4249 family protein [Muribaculum sp. NM65_B17]TGY04976.1 DUF4249 family protein [Muribaculum sp. NM65_B17]THG44787.1 DUF4249 family protein [Muribaculaceae bacterium]